MSDFRTIEGPSHFLLVRFRPLRFVVLFCFCLKEQGTLSVDADTVELKMCAVTEGILTDAFG